MASTGPDWTPSSGHESPDRGRHRVHKKPRRGSSAFLGVAAIGAVAAGSVAGTHGDRQERAHAHLSTADSASASTASSHADSGGQPDAAPQASAGTSSSGLKAINAAARTLPRHLAAQADQQHADAQARAHAKAEKARVAKEKARIAKEKAKEKAEKEHRERVAKAKAEKERAEKARAAREAKRKRLARSWKLPVSNYRISAGFGQSGSRWSQKHTGLDFAASTGVSAKSIGSGTVEKAGWAGAYGYRVVVRHQDGTESWYCHLSSITKTSGDVTPGEQLGRVGATGNVTGPHLHLEIRPGGGEPVDPAPWLRHHGLTV